MASMSSTLTFEKAIAAVKKNARDVQNGAVEVRVLKKAARDLMDLPEYRTSANAQRLIDAVKELVKKKDEGSAGTAQVIEKDAKVCAVRSPNKKDMENAADATFRTSLFSGPHGACLYTFILVNGKKYYIRVFALNGNKYISIHESWYVQAKTGPAAADLFKKVQRKEKKAEKNLFADDSPDDLSPFADPLDDLSDPFASPSSAEGGAASGGGGGARAMSGGGASGGGASGGGAAEKPSLPVSKAAELESIPFLDRAFDEAIDGDKFEHAEKLDAKRQAAYAKAAELVALLNDIPEIVAIVKSMQPGPLSVASISFDFLTELFSKARQENTIGLPALARLKALYTPLPKVPPLPPVQTPADVAQELKDKITHVMTTAGLPLSLPLETVEEVKSVLKNDESYGKNREVRGLLVELAKHYQSLA